VSNEIGRFSLCKTEADAGITGTNTKKRKEFNRMIADAESGKFDLILTKEISRFARNTLDSIYFTRELKRHGIGVIFLNDNINTLNEDAELRLAIMSSIAQEESRKTSERVKWGQKRQMEQGVVFGRSMLGYDVKNGKLYLNEEGAKIVRLIFYKFVKEGKGTYVIARELYEEGIYPMYGKEWKNSVILRILRNEKYCGDLIQKKTYTPDFLSHEKKYNRGQEEFVILKNHHEPIISRKLFEEANHILDSRSHSQEGKAKYSSRYLFSGKIKCGYCKASYVARYKIRKDKTSYQAWRCLKAMQHGKPHIDLAGNQVGCPGVGIRNEEIIHILCLVIQNLKYDREKIENNLVTILRNSLFGDRDAFYSQRKAYAQKIEEKQGRLLELYLSGEIRKEEFFNVKRKYEAEKVGLSLPLELAKERQDFDKEQEGMQKIREVIQEILNGLEYEDEFYRQILDRVVVYGYERWDVYLKQISLPWSFRNSDADVPISVNRPATLEFDML